MTPTHVIGSDLWWKFPRYCPPLTHWSLVVIAAHIHQLFIEYSSTIHPSQARSEKEEPRSAIDIIALFRYPSSWPLLHIFPLSPPPPNQKNLSRTLTDLTIVHFPPRDKIVQTLTSNPILLNSLSLDPQTTLPYAQFKNHPQETRIATMRMQILAHHPLPHANLPHIHPSQTEN